MNHLEGRTAGFFCYGDAGGDELDAGGRPLILRHPSYFDPAEEPFAEMRNAYAPLVWQCRYGGIEVPDPLWHYVEFGAGQKYSDSQAEAMAADDDVLGEFDAWTDRFQATTATKGPVPPGEYRAVGHVAPRHRVADLKLKWRQLRISAGIPAAGSSPAKQQELGLNHDRTFSPDTSGHDR